MEPTLISVTAFAALLGSALGAFTYALCRDAARPLAALARKAATNARWAVWHARQRAALAPGFRYEGWNPQCGPYGAFTWASAPYEILRDPRTGECAVVKDHVYVMDERQTRPMPFKSPRAAALYVRDQAQRETR